MKVPSMLPKPPTMITPKAMMRKATPDVGLNGKVRPRNTPAIAAIAIALPILGQSKIKDWKLDKLVKLGASLISYRFGNRSGDLVVSDIDSMINLWKQHKEQSIT